MKVLVVFEIYKSIEIQLVQIGPQFFLVRGLNYSYGHNKSEMAFHNY